MLSYIGINNRAKTIPTMYIGVNNVAKKISAIYVGDKNGVAKLIYADSVGKKTTVSYIDGSKKSFLVEGELLSTSIDNIAEVKKIVIGNEVTNIGAQVFYNCETLESIEFSDDVETIGEQAFFGCSKLSKIHIGSNIKNIDITSFENCTNITEITISENNTNFVIKDGLLYDIDLNKAYIITRNVKNFVIPEDMTYIPDYMFSGCGALTSITLNEVVETIGNHSFENCSSLNEIILPASVATIGDNAFAGCTSLETIHINNTDGIISIKPTTFDSNVTVYVPIEFLIEYQKTYEDYPCTFKKNNENLVIVDIPATENQYIKVIAGGKEYTESFITDKGTYYSATAYANSDDYDEGELNTVGGRLDDDLILTVTPATKTDGTPKSKTYTVTIINDDDNQNIRVYSNYRMRRGEGMILEEDYTEYTSSFVENENIRICMDVAPNDESIKPGNVLINGGVKPLTSIKRDERVRMMALAETITGNVTISATPSSKRKLCTVTINQQPNELVTLNYTSTPPVINLKNITTCLYDEDYKEKYYDSDRYLGYIGYPNTKTESFSIYEGNACEIYAKCDIGYDKSGTITIKNLSDNSTDEQSVRISRTLNITDDIEINITPTHKQNPVVIAKVTCADWTNGSSYEIGSNPNYMGSIVNDPSNEINLRDFYRHNWVDDNPARYSISIDLTKEINYPKINMYINDKFVAAITNRSSSNIYLSEYDSAFNEVFKYLSIGAVLNVKLVGTT